MRVDGKINSIIDWVTAANVAMVPSSKELGLNPIPPLDRS